MVWNFSFIFFPSVRSTPKILLSLSEHILNRRSIHDQILAFSKTDPGTGEWILGVVNLDPFHVQTGWLSFAPGGSGDLSVEDLMTGSVYHWSSGRHYIRLDPTDPNLLPFHILRRAS